jgi:hypothetical protein
MDDDEKARFLRESEVMWIKQQNMACLHAILVPEHYRVDGTCRCNDPKHREMKAWGYVWDRKAKAWGAGE